MLTQPASYYAMGFVMWFIGFGVGAITAGIIRMRYRDREVNECYETISSLDFQCDTLESANAILRDRLDDYHYDGRP